MEGIAPASSRSLPVVTMDSGLTLGKIKRMVGSVPAANCG
jgi:hypothetical protein